MTFSEIINASKTTLYLNGSDAYRREYDFTSHTKKIDFEKLLDNRKSVVVIVSKTTAEKYARRINRLGFLLKAKEDYNSDEYILYYEKLHFNNIPV